MSSGCRVVRRRLSAVALLLLLVVLATGDMSRAALITLRDNSSQVAVDPLLSTGMTDWSVDGTDYLTEHGFWYLLGNSGLAQPVSALGLISSVAIDTNADGFADTATLHYGAAGGLQVMVKYSIVGGQPGSGSSNLGEQVSLTNSSAAPMSVRLYQYTNADLGDGPDTVEFVSPSDVVQSSSVGVLESVVTGASPIDEAGLTSLAPTTRYKLENINALTLNGDVGPLTGDAIFAYQWNASIQPNRSITIGQSSSLNVTPEPSSLGLLVAAGAGVALATRVRCGRGSSCGPVACPSRPADILAFPTRETDDQSRRRVA